jgi:hypothetical protein
MPDATELLKRFRIDKGGTDGGSEFDERDEARGSCYAWLRGRSERVEMVEFRFRSGRHLALAYSWLFSVDFDPPHGLTLNFGDVLVGLQGRGLAHVAECARRHRLLWVEEVDPVRDPGPDSAPTVSSILIRRPPSEGDAESG